MDCKVCGHSKEEHLHESTPNFYYLLWCKKCPPNCEGFDKEKKRL